MRLGHEPFDVTDSDGFIPGPRGELSDLVLERRCVVTDKLHEPAGGRSVNVQAVTLELSANPRGVVEPAPPSPSRHVEAQDVAHRRTHFGQIARARRCANEREHRVRGRLLEVCGDGIDVGLLPPAHTADEHEPLAVSEQPESVQAGHHVGPRGRLGALFSAQLVDRLGQEARLQPL